MKKTTKSELAVIDQIVAVGSVDGVLTTAAMLRVIGKQPEDVGLVFCQAFTVDKVDMSGWKPNSKVAFVDLAVNNRDKPMTAEFIRRLDEAGHKVVAICDEHSREDWREVFGRDQVDELLIQPQSQAEGIYKSSGALFLAALDSVVQPGTVECELDEDTRVLCHLADEADRMIFISIGKAVNEAVKSKIADDSRRVYLARHYAQSLEPDNTIRGWIAEYDKILANHEEVLAAKQDLGDGIVRVSAVGKVVDMTTLMSGLYKSGAVVVILEGEMFNKVLGRKTIQVSFATGTKLDLLTCLKAVVPTASGFASKVNIEPEQEAAALGAVRAALASPK